MKKHSQKGFTLIELMIAVTILGILAAIAVPQYQDYTMRTRVHDMVNVASGYKADIQLCFHDTRDLTLCDAGANGVPAATGAVGRVIQNINVVDGVITATPQAVNGLAATDTYVLTPVAAPNGALVWTATGGAVTRGWVRQ